MEQADEDLPECWRLRNLPEHIGIGSRAQTILNLGHVKGVYRKYKLLVDLCLPHLLANLPNRDCATDEQPNKQQEEKRKTTAFFHS